MERYIKDFETKLLGIDFQTIENSSHSIFGLSKKLELIYFNRAWLAFAKANNGEPDISRRFPLGTPLQEAISGELKNLYIQKYNEVLKTCKPWYHEYECSSSRIYRIFHQGVYPLKNGEGLIVVNSIKIEKKLRRRNGTVLSPKKEDYLQEFGLLTQCSNCRRTQRAHEPGIWDWIPSWVEKTPEGVSHSICPICFDFYWKS